ncbi:MAG: transcription antitermination factor NusB [Acidimicrobiia bacterium]
MNPPTAAPPSQPSRIPEFGSRREQRDRLLGLIYQMDLREVSAAKIIESQGDELEPFVTERLIGIEAHRVEIDALLDEYSQQWTVSRMPLLDRAAMRLATFELAHCPEIPTAVVVSEAVELVRKYSTAESQRFVNGLLGKIAIEARPGAAQ